jgi:hypothetical protein
MSAKTASPEDPRSEWNPMNLLTLDPYLSKSFQNLPITIRQISIGITKMKPVMI